MSNYKEWFVKLKDQRNQRPIDDDSGVAYVLVAASPVEIAIVDRFGTALANPLAFSNGELRFYTAKSVTSLDISLLTATGYAVYATSIDNSEHSLFIDREQRSQLLVVPYAASDNTLVDTGFDLPANLVIQEAMLRVVTVDAGETIDFGFANAVESGDLDGLIVAALVSAAGLIELRPQITGGSNIDFGSTNFVGALLATTIAGADAVATVGGSTPKNYRTDGMIKSLVYTGSAGSDVAAGFFYLRYLKLV